MTIMVDKDDISLKNIESIWPPSHKKLIQVLYRQKKNSGWCNNVYQSIITYHVIAFKFNVQ